MLLTNRILTTIDVLYYDDNILVINKLPGVPVIPGRGLLCGCSLHEQLEEALKEKLYIVHRIDRATSGIIIFARNSEAHRTLSMKFENRDIKKSYIALINGEIECDGYFDTPIHQFGSGRMGVHKTGKHSVTQYSVIEKFKSATLVQVNPLSGRRHQIRVHFYHSGHPIMGDPLYGSIRPVGGVQRLMLHASEVNLEIGSRKLIFKAPTDTMWSEIVQSYRDSN